MLWIVLHFYLVSATTTQLQGHLWIIYINDIQQVINIFINLEIWEHTEMEQINFVTPTLGLIYSDFLPIKCPQKMICYNWPCVISVDCIALHSWNVNIDLQILKQKPTIRPPKQYFIHVLQQV